MGTTRSRSDLSFTNLPATTATALVLVPLAGKFAGAFVGTYVTRIDAPFALAAGLMSKGVAEIAFLLVLLESGTIEKDVFSLLVLIMFGYILFMPAVINFAVRRTVLPERPALPDSVTPSFARYALQRRSETQRGWVTRLSARPLTSEAPLAPSCRPLEARR